MQKANNYERLIYPNSDKSVITTRIKVPDDFTIGKSFTFNRNCYTCKTLINTDYNTNNLNPIAGPFKPESEMLVSRPISFLA